MILLATAPPRMTHLYIFNSMIEHSHPENSMAATDLQFVVATATHDSPPQLNTIVGGVLFFDFTVFLRLSPHASCT